MSHLRAIQACFPHLVGLFVFDTGRIVALNPGFAWGIYNARDAKEYLAHAMFFDVKSMERHTDLRDLLLHVHRVDSIRS